MPKRLLVISALLLQAALAWAGADAIVGTWRTEDGDSKVEITAAPAEGGTVLSGKVVWLEHPTRDGEPVRDEKNGDAALRARPILGLEILSGFRPSSGGSWSGGTLYSPRRGEGYPAELSPTPDGRLSVEVKAGLLSRTVYWTR